VTKLRCGGGLQAEYNRAADSQIGLSDGVAGAQGDQDKRTLCLVNNVNGIEQCRKQSDQQQSVAFYGTHCITSIHLNC
jgi:hypothetical protein